MIVFAILLSIREEKPVLNHEGRRPRRNERFTDRLDMTLTQPPPAIIANLEKLLNGPRDGALLRYSLGNEWLKAGNATKAVDYLRSSLSLAPDSSAGWKQLGKALSTSGDIPAALEAYANGIRVAEGKGDIQAAKEMTVFAKRLRKLTGTD